jgi:hypothetical protein
VARPSGDHEPHPGGVGRCGDLPEHDEADRRRRGREERDEKRIGRARKPRHRELVADVGDDRGRDAHADPRSHEHRVGQGVRGRGGRRRDRDRRREHRTRQPVDARDARASGDPVGEDDVAGEEPGVREGDGDPERRSAQVHIGYRVDAAGGNAERDTVPGRPHPDRREPDHRQELDRGHGTERQVVDGRVEAGVHGRQDAPHERDEPAGLRAGLRQGAPGAPPDPQDERGAHDPKPGHPQRLDSGEEEDRERRPEVVEHGASDEVARRREPAHRRILEARLPHRKG